MRYNEVELYFCNQKNSTGKHLLNNENHNRSIAVKAFIFNAPCFQEGSYETSQLVAGARWGIPRQKKTHGRKQNHLGLHPIQDSFNSYETSQSVGGGDSEKTTLQYNKKNLAFLVCVGLEVEAKPDTPLCDIIKLLDGHRVTGRRTRCWAQTHIRHSREMIE